MLTSFPRPAVATVILSLALALRLLAAWAIPLGSGTLDPNCAPDELDHFRVTRALATGRAARWPEDTTSVYANFPPIQYAVQALALGSGAVLGIDGSRLQRLPSVDPEARGHLVARLGSVLLGTLAVAVIMFATGRWTGSRRAAAVGGLVAALYPQAIFLSAYVNADAWTFLAGALLCAAVARWARGGEGETGLRSLGVAAGLVLTGKPSGWFLLPTTALWLSWAVVQHRARLIAAARAALIALLVGAPPLGWNGLRRGGDPLGLAGYRRWLEQHDAVMATAFERAHPWFDFALWLGKSAVAQFGNMHLSLPVPFYVVALGLLLMGLGMTRPGAREARDFVLRGALWLATSFALNLGLVAWNSWFVDFSPQGRYVLLMLILTTVLAAWGPAWRRRPGRLRYWPMVYVGFLAVAAFATEVLLLVAPCRP